MKVSEIMTHNAEVIQATDKVAHAAKKMKELNIGALPVFDKENPVGMLTDRDIILRLVAHERDPGLTAVGEIMTPEIIWCEEDMEIQDAAHIMEYKQIRRLLVKNKQDQFVGVLSIGDLATSVDRKLTGEVLHDVIGTAHPER